MAKFDWVPYLEGKYLTYYQWFALLGSTAAVLLSILSFGIYLITCRIKPKNKGHIGKSWIDSLKQISFNGGFIFLSLVPLFCSAMDVIWLVEGMVGMMAIYTLMILINNGRMNRKYTGYSQFEQQNYGESSLLFKKFIRKCLSINPIVKKKLIIAAFFSILLPLLMYKTCLCFYNAQIGYYSPTLGFGINTYLSRLFQLKVSCPPGPPCQMYATIPENPEEAFFLNLHTHHAVSNVTVYYQQQLTPDTQKFLTVKAETYDYYGIQWKATRRVHSALIKDLKPNTRYLLKVHYQNRFWTNAIYKTLPRDPSTPIRMLNAGDSGYTHESINMSQIASQLKPDIFFMGGDVAYDDNMPACAYTWDYFLTMYGRLTTSLGYLMPLVLSVGNHDVGLNQLPNITISIDNYGPAFFIYFPQHYDRNLDGHIVKQIPPIKNRRAVLNFTFSNVHYLVLDSGYLNSFDGEQKKFMINSFEANQKKIKFVNYHVPIYSGCEKFDKNPERFLYQLFHWVPNFDKYKVMTVFQNHVHSFKRTKPLVGSYPKENGTVYLGDGAYGAIVSQFCRPDVTLDIFATWATKNNMWLSQIRDDKVIHIAYDSRGNIVDNFTQRIDAYV